jgi:hypothetical protein
MSDVFGAGAPPGLAPYCLYTWGGGTPLPGLADVTALQASLSGVPGLAFEEDCVVVGPQSGSLAAEARLWVRRTFHDQAGGMPALPVGNPASIHVAVPDSSPASVGSAAIPKGRLEHGYTMAWLIRDLTCSAPGSCVSTISTQLALPRVTNNSVDLLEGGYFGTRVELAQAIFDAVEGWKSAFPAQPRLVINLSVGWDFDSSCGSPSAPGSMMISEGAVFAALTHASCHGALVVAAAGNDPGGALPHYPAGWPAAPMGPICPAAWSTEPAPTSAQCSAFEHPKYADDISGYPLLYTPPSPPPPELVDDALLFAVGGVDYDNKRITRTRTGGLPRVVALGLQGVAGEPNVPLPQPLTGTSVASAAVSGVAAAVWAYRPELTATEVMDIVYRSGVILPYSADFKTGGVNGMVRRASLCAALKEACPAGNTHPRCPTQAITCAPDSTGSQNPPLTPTLRDLLEVEWNGAPSYAPSPYAPWMPAPEAEWRSFAAAPWIHPQPDRPPCGACVFAPGDDRLYVEIDGDYPADLSLSRMTLKLTGPSWQGLGSPTTVVYDLTSPSTMTRNTPAFTIDGIDWSASALSSVSTAKLSWIVTDTDDGTTASVQEQILIDL